MAGNVAQSGSRRRDDDRVQASHDSNGRCGARSRRGTYGGLAGIGWLKLGMRSVDLDDGRPGANYRRPSDPISGPLAFGVDYCRPESESFLP